MQPSNLKMQEWCLAAMEAREAVSLSWGFVDGYLTEHELEALFTAALKANGASESAWETILEQLVESKVVRTWREERERRYRSRIGELVRLLVRCRQWFPSKSWTDAPSLVADFRLDIRPRRYPKRTVTRSETWQAVQALGPSLAVQKDFFEGLLPENGRLAQFQVDAIKRLIGSTTEGGTIVTAGTGSGKTLAFYIPAVANIATDLSTSRFSAAIAVYPRQELLKDQLTEALKLCSRLNGTLAAQGKRPICLGAYFGGAPSTSADVELTRKKWVRRGGAFVCPLVRCPTCGGDMIWAAEHRSKGHEVLTCVQSSCSTQTQLGALSLTRDSIVRSPPDILFTTTEMMNQRLSDTRVRHIFGIGRPKQQRPRFMLLDEVHTYSGVSGAQTGLLLRRWRKLVSSPISWVGLSATLRDSEQFFAVLTGLRTDQVAEISPQEQDVEEEGAEYQLVLRSDPASQTSTLSTSIQAIMLTARMLDPKPEGASNSLYGSKLFAFTDDLDATNRLFDNFRDAEAYDRFGRPDLQRRPLAALRESGTSDELAREAQGQRWALAEQIQGSLDARMAVSRTSSRDQGVDASSNVVIATSALEVGFNDPDVGAVLQHKAPRGSASFLQRRGRAGRRRGMRPIAISVLSDYGRDRIAFQTFERLFDPVVDRQPLPVRNTYILRIQATYALLDWLAHKAATEGNGGWAWKELSEPKAGNARVGFLGSARKWLQQLVQLDENAVQDLSAFIRDSLQIDDATIQLVLWQPPRALLTEAIPTLARRLFRDWDLATGSGKDIFVPYHPLPDFVPAALFAELSVPEITIDLPPDRIGEERHQESMSAFQAIQQFAPGRVRRRFADEFGGLAHWIPIDHSGPSTAVCINDLAPASDFVDTFPAQIDGTRVQLPVYRPWSLAVHKVKESEVLHTSNAFWNWQSSFDERGQPLVLCAPATSDWHAVMPELRFYLHRFGGALSVGRFAASGRADIRRRNDGQVVNFGLCDAAGHPVGVGFAYEGDALLIRLGMPRPTQQQIAALSEETLQWLRTAFVKDRVLKSRLLPEDINTFQRDWIFLSTLVAALVRAEHAGESLSHAVSSVLSDDDGAPVLAALSHLIADNNQDTSHAAGGSRLEDGLRTLLAQSAIREAFSTTFTEALSCRGEPWVEWIGTLLDNTLAEAVLQACAIAAPENSALDGLTVELRVNDDGHRDIVIVESTVGGGGTLEVLAHSFALDPRTFFQALQAALVPSDLETASRNLERVARIVVEDDTCRRAMADLRAASSHLERSARRAPLIQQLTECGVVIDQTLSVAIATRLLRPGTGPESDSATCSLISARAELQGKYGLGLPLRISPAVLTLCFQRLVDDLEQLGGSGAARSVADLLMWTDSGELRGRGLQSYNPYRGDVQTDGALIRELITSWFSQPVVSFNDADWDVEARAALTTSGKVRVICPRGSERSFAECLSGFLTIPVSTEYLQFFPAIEGILRLDSGDTAGDLVLREWV